MKVLIVIGTRPEAIKMAPLIQILKSDSRFTTLLCVTAQHRQMLDQVLDLFDLHPDFDLDIMKEGQSLTGVTTEILDGMQVVFGKFTPDIVLVHGDTTTTLAATLSSYYHKIPVGHVEAGLRTGNIYSPWPEEANRKIASVLAAVHFAPSAESRQNLINEGVSSEKIHVTGNTVIDTLKQVSFRLKNNKTLNLELEQRFPFLNHSRRIILVTGHRRESFGGGFDRICESLQIIAGEFPNVDIVYPVHLNPNVQEPVKRLLSETSNIHLIEPQEYLPFIYLMDRSYLIITDSGGIQEEAPSLGKPVLLMRETTERPEAVIAGTVKLVGTEISTITDNLRGLLTLPDLYNAMCIAKNPYGDGNACNRIVDLLISGALRK
jgi:UDP-N-acetylglucosamine 2-epimerase (non-hydrolysing)